MCPLKLGTQWSKGVYVPFYLISVLTVVCTNPWREIPKGLWLICACYCPHQVHIPFCVVCRLPFLRGTLCESCSSVLSPYLPWVWVLCCLLDPGFSRPAHLILGFATRVGLRQLLKKVTFLWNLQLLPQPSNSVARHFLLQHLILHQQPIVVCLPFYKGHLNTRKKFQIHEGFIVFCFFLNQGNFRQGILPQFLLYLIGWFSICFGGWLHLSAPRLSSHPSVHILPSSATTRPPGQDTARLHHQLRLAWPCCRRQLPRRS